MVVLTLMYLCVLSMQLHHIGNIRLGLGVSRFDVVVGHRSEAKDSLSSEGEDEAIDQQKQIALGILVFSYFNTASLQQSSLLSNEAYFNLCQNH